jgi:hypothetical protein
MKTVPVNLLKVLALLALLFSFSNVYAEQRKIRFAPLVIDSFSLTVQNLVQTANNKLEYDVYMADDDGDLDIFELASFQFGFLINSSIYDGGILTVTIDNSTSMLNLGQKITANPNATTKIGNQTVIKLVSGIVLPGQGTILGKKSPGTLITHYILTSSVSFPNNSKADLTFTSSTATYPSYATRVAEFISGSSTPLDINDHEYVNAVVVGNPILNSTYTGFTNGNQATVYTYSQNKNIFVHCSERANLIQIYNTLGSLIYETNNVEGLKKIDMNKQAIAYYFVKIVTTDQVFTNKVLLK